MSHLPTEAVQQAASAMQEAIAELPLGMTFKNPDGTIIPNIQTLIMADGTGTVTDNGDGTATFNPAPSSTGVNDV